MTETIRLTAAQAMVRYHGAQMTEDGVQFITGGWAIFGHGVIARLGEALHHAQEYLSKYRGRTKNPCPMRPSPMQASCAASAR